MSKTVKRLAVVAVMAGLAGGAQAGPTIGQTASYDFGLLTKSDAVTVGQFSGAFDNIFTFTAAKYPAAENLVAGLDVVGDMTMNMSFGGGSTPSWSVPIKVGALQDPNTGAFSFASVIKNLTPGQVYSFEFTGSASNASYSFALSPSPVPEPESWMLMLSGMALMGTVVRRRRNQVVKGGATT